MKIPLSCARALIGANLSPRVTGLEALTGKVNYFLGNDPKKWRTNIPTYAKVKYHDVYPGIDLIYYGNRQQLEYDFIVAPGADPNAIIFEFGKVAANLKRRPAPQVNDQGDLVLPTAGGQIRLNRPLAYQEVNGVQREISASYIFKGERRVGFQVAKYDGSRPLIIDPVLTYSTYLGVAGLDEGEAIAVDTAGNAYVTGVAGSTNFPTTPGAFQTTLGGFGGVFGFGDAFVTKLNPTGSALVYSTYIGGGGDDVSTGIAVDAAGNAYLTGLTNSRVTFPTTPGAFQTTFGGGSFDAFVTKLNPTGSGLVYSTYLGGLAQDDASRIAVDAAGSAYVTGETNSINFPTTPAVFQSSLGGDFDAFVTKLNPAGSGLAYSTFLGGGATDSGIDIAVDASGNAYVIGNSSSTDFPTTAGAFRTSFGGTRDAFVAKVNSTASALLYSTYLGGHGDDRGRGIAVDSAGNAYVTGLTNSGNFPFSPSAFQTAFNGVFDAFVAKVNPSGSGLVYSTFLGGTARDEGNSIAVDVAGNAYVTGETESSNFPTANAVQPALGGASDAFVTKLNPTGSALLFSTYLGGNSFDAGGGIALDAASDPNAYVAGSTDSNNFPTTAGAFQTIFGGNRDAFIAKIPPPDTTPPVTTASPAPGPNASGWNNTNVTVTLTATDNPGGSGVQSFSYTLAGAQTGSAVITGNTTSITISTEGITTLTYHARDNAGNVEADKVLAVRIDKSAPITIANPTPSPNVSGWNNSDVTVNLAATDSSAGSGVQSIVFTLSGAQIGTGAATGGLASVTVSAEGTTTLSYHARDNAGNVEADKTLTIRIDKTPPALALPPDQTLEATSASGAVATFTPSATDALSGLASLTSVPPSGSTFPLGTTTVTVTAKDVAGNTSSGTFTVTVRDTVPPILGPVSNLSVEATSPAGAIVNFFLPPATDNLDPGPVVTATPPSGSNFPAGTTTVTVTARDASGNTTSKTFAMTVKVNHAPVAMNDSYTTDPNTPLAVAAPGVLTNDTDADGDALKALLVSPPNNGTLGLNTDGSFRYTPNTNFSGTDSFTYQASDGRLSSYLSSFTTTSPLLPEGFFGHTAVSVKGYLYRVAGLGSASGVQIANTVYFAPIRLDGSLGAWTQTASLPDSIFFHSATVHGARIYVIGGFRYNFQANALEISNRVFYATVNPEGTLGSWTQTASLPVASFFNSAGSWNGALYVTGGWTGEALTNAVYFASVNTDGSLAGWLPTTPLPQAIYTHAMVQHQGTLYVIGGAVNAGTTLQNLVYYAPINADKTVGTWNTTTALPQTLSNHSAAVAGNKIFVTGGFNGRDVVDKVYSTEIKSDRTLGPWTTEINLPYPPIVFHSVTVGNGTFYVTGGTNEIAPRNAIYYWKFDKPSLATATINVKGTSIITWPTPADIVYGTALSSTQLNATASVPGSFVYAPPEGTILNAGTQTLSVTFTPADTTKYTTATAGVLINVTKATPTVNVTGGTFTYDGKPHAATGSVVGVNNENLGAPIFGYTPGVSAAPVNSGTYSVVGSFPGNANYNPATNNSAAIVINKAQATISLSNLTQTYDGLPKPVTATTNPPGLIGLSLTYNGLPTAPTNAGSYTVVASLAHDNYAATNATGTLVINKATPQFSGLTDQTIVYGTTYLGVSGRIAAGSLIPTGSVSVTLNGVTQSAPIDPTSGNVSTTFTTSMLGVPGSPYTIGYNYSGDLNFNSTAGTRLLTVNKAATSTVVSSSANPSTRGTAVTFSAAVSSSAGIVPGDIQFFDVTTLLATVSLAAGRASISTSALSVGTHSITAVYSGSANFSSSTSPGLSQTVNRAGTSTSLTSNSNPSISGQSVTFTATVSSSADPPTGTVQFFDGTTSLGTASVVSSSASISTSALSAGIHSITAVYSGDANLLGSSSPALSQTISALTPVGSNVTLPPFFGSPVFSIVFGNISSPGATTVFPIDPISAGLLPPGFRRITLPASILKRQESESLSAGFVPNELAVSNDGAAFDLATTATYTGPITVCFKLPSITDPTTFSNLRVLHKVAGKLVDETILEGPNAPNFAGNTICAKVTVLSPFVIALVIDHTPPTIASASVDKPVLRPPNHQMVDVTVNYDVSDDYTPAADIACRLKAKRAK